MEDRFIRAQALIRDGDYRQALGLLGTLDSVPTDRAAEIAFLRGWCLELLGSDQHSEAVACYQEAAGLGGSPDLRVNSWFRAGWVEQLRRNHAAAERFFARAIEAADALGVRNQTYSHACYWQAVCWELEGRYIDARGRYGFVAEMEPELRLECAYREIQCFMAVGDFEMALACCDRVRAERPPSDEPRELEVRELIGKEAAALRAILASA